MRESVRCAVTQERKKKASAVILREQTVIENCEEAVSVLSVCESKEKLERFFLAVRHTQKGFGVSSREFVEC